MLILAYICSINLIKYTYMKYIRSLIHLAILMLCISIPVQGQSVSDPVTWTLRVKMTSATEGEMILKANIEPGWHLYGFNIPKGGPQATKIDLTGCKDVRFTDKLTMSSAPLTVKDEAFDMTVTWWDSTVTFKRKFKVEGANPFISAQVTYMACDNVNCRPPKTETLNKKVIVK